MIKRMLLGILLILCASFNPYDNIKDFHTKAVGSEKVEQFRKRFPQIVNNKSVYIAYLQRYYKGNEFQFHQLLNLN